MAALERASAAVQVAQGRLESLNELETNLEGEAEEVRVRVEHALAELDAAKKEEDAELDALAKLRIELSGADDEAKRLSAELSKIEIRLAAERSKLAQKQKLELEQAHRSERIEQVKEELDGISATTPDLQTAIDEAETEYDGLAQVVQDTKADIIEAEKGLRGVDAGDERAAAEARKVLSEVAALDGRRRGIEATIDAHEGLAQGARAVMMALDQGLLTGSYSPLGSAIEVFPEYALAIDTALGASANDLIVPDEAHAKRAIALLKEKRLGRATFQPIPLMRPQAQSQDLREVLHMKGVVGLASELVRCDAKHRPVVDSVLGRVVVTEDIDAALQLARTRGWSRMVTLDGEVVHSSGAVTGGASSRQTTGLVQRKAELTEVEDKLQKLQKNLAVIQSSQKKRDDDRAAYRANIEALRKRLETEVVDAEEARTWFMNLKHEFTAADRSREKLQLELDTLLSVGEAKDIVVDVDSVEAERDEVLKALASRSADADQAAERLQEAELRTQSSSRRKQEAERRLSSAQAAEHARTRRAENLEPERERLAEQITQAEQARQAADVEVQALSAKLTAKLEEKKNLHDEAFKLAEESKTAQKSSHGCAEAAHEGELKRARADSKRGGTGPIRPLEGRSGTRRTSRDAALRARPRERSPTGRTGTGAVECRPQQQPVLAAWAHQ